MGDSSFCTIPSSTHRPFKHDKVCGDAAWDSDHAEVRSTSTIGITSDHLVDLVLGWVDCTWKSIAARTIADNLDTPGRHNISKWSARLKVYWVPRKFNERVTVLISVSTSNVRTPIAIIILICAPNARCVCIYSWWIYIEASKLLVFF